jgi:DNA-binding SARP family transcriptional activator
METLLVSLFGQVQIAKGDWSQELKIAPRSQTLFAYLILHGQQSHSRAVLTGIFWPEYDEEKARNCLNTTLWRLRSMLELDVPKGTYLLTNTNGDIAFNASSDYWLDVAVFEQHLPQKYAVEGTITDNQAEELMQALEIYTADLMENHYEDWALLKREQLRQTYIEGLIDLMRYHFEKDELALSVNVARRILQLDPLREHVHRQLIRLYSLMGHPTRALRQYEECREILTTELHVVPMAETQELYRSILASRSDLLKGKHREAKDLQVKLRAVMVSLDKAKRQVQEIMNQTGKLE